MTSLRPGSRFMVVSFLVLFELRFLLELILLLFSLIWFDLMPSESDRFLSGWLRTHTETTTLDGHLLIGAPIETYFRANKVNRRCK